jgi:hypothetical protein
MNPGELIALNPISFDDILETSNSIENDKNLLMLAKSELSRLNDLTDNEMVIRQINCSLILNRLIRRRISCEQRGIKVSDTPFDFETDFYE